MRKHNIFDPDIRQCIRIIERAVSREGYAAIAARSPVTTQTLRNWLNYKVLSPQSAKLFATTRACGGEITVWSPK